MLDATTDKKPHECWSIAWATQDGTIIAAGPTLQIHSLLHHDTEPMGDNLTIHHFYGGQSIMDDMMHHITHQLHGQDFLSRHTDSQFIMDMDHYAHHLRH